MERTKAIESINWKEKGDFRYRKGLSAKMLSEEGENISEKNRLLGEARNIPKKRRITNYGKDYCVAKLARDFIAPLEITNKELFLELAVEAWNYYLWNEKQGGTLSGAPKQE